MTRDRLEKQSHAPGFSGVWTPPRRRGDRRGRDAAQDEGSRSRDRDRRHDHRRHGLGDSGATARGVREGSANPAARRARESRSGRRPHRGHVREPLQGRRHDSPASTTDRHFTVLSASDRPRPWSQRSLQDRADRCERLQPRPLSARRPSPEIRFKPRRSSSTSFPLEWRRLCRGCDRLRRRLVRGSGFPSNAVLQS